MRLQDYAKDLEHELRVERARTRSLESELDQARSTIRTQGEFILSLKQEIGSFMRGEQ